NILFVNPYTLFLEGFEELPSGITGMAAVADFTVTAIAGVVGMLFLGDIFKYLICFGTGMGLIVLFAYKFVLRSGGYVELGLTGVLASGIIFIVLTLIGLLEKIINYIPPNLKLSVGAGIGFFIAFLGFQNAGIIIGDPDTLVSIGNLTEPFVMLSIFGIVISV